jgi:hypothetical protein
MSSKILKVAFIYRISTADDSKAFYGSTINFDTYNKTMRTNYQQFLNGNRNRLTVFEIMEDTNYKSEIVKYLQNVSKKDLLQTLSTYIESNPCINQKRIYGDRAKSFREYYQRSFERIQKKEQEYYEQNKEKILLRIKNTRLAKKCISIQRTKKMIDCDCGSFICEQFIKKHYESKKHKTFEICKNGYCIYNRC